MTNPQPSEAHRNHIVPNDNTDGAMTSAKSSKPSEDTEPHLHQYKTGEDFCTYCGIPWPKGSSEDTEKLSVDWIIKELSLSSPLAQFNSQRLREMIAAHDRNLLAGIVEKAEDFEIDTTELAGYPTSKWVKAVPVTAIVKAATLGKEK